MHSRSSQILAPVQGISSKVELRVSVLAHLFLSNSCSRTRILIKSRVEGFYSCTVVPHKFLFPYKDSYQKSSWGFLFWLSLLLPWLLPWLLPLLLPCLPPLLWLLLLCLLRLPCCSGCCCPATVVAAAALLARLLLLFWPPWLLLPCCRRRCTGNCPGECFVCSCCYSGLCLVGSASCASS